MTIKQLETDYLIIGSGAVGMAFADVLLSETEANILIVDKHHKPCQYLQQEQKYGGVQILP